VRRRIGVVAGQVEHWMVPQADGPSSRRAGAGLHGAPVPLPPGESQHDHGRPAQLSRRLLQARRHGRLRSAAARPLHLRPAAALPRSHQPRQAGPGPQLRRLLAPPASLGGACSPDFPRFAARRCPSAPHCTERRPSRSRWVRQFIA
jgi:hypothetical protein